MSLLSLSRSSSSVNNYDIIRIENEIEVLQSIYMDNLERVNLNEPQEIKIKLTPGLVANTAKSPFCWLELKLKYNKGYPRVVPEIEISNKYNITEEETEILNEGIDDIAFEKSDQNVEMVHDICEYVQNFLSDKCQTYNPKKRQNNTTIDENKPPRKRSSAQDLNKPNDKYHDLKKFLKEGNELKMTVSSINLNMDEHGLGIGRENSNPINNSRFTTDFEIIEKVGQGGGGSVYKVKNKFDGMFYAIKKVNFFVKLTD